MLRCANHWNRKKRCTNQAVYRQNPYVELCASCFNEITDNMFKLWHKWFLSDRKMPEPTMWVYNTDKIILPQ